jgi:hypothetical protein
MAESRRMTADEAATHLRDIRGNPPSLDGMTWRLDDRRTERPGLRLWRDPINVRVNEFGWEVSDFGPLKAAVVIRIPAFVARAWVWLRTL